MSHYIKLSCCVVFVGAIKPLLSIGSTAGSFRPNHGSKDSNQAQIKRQPGCLFSIVHFESDHGGLSMATTYLFWAHGSKAAANWVDCRNWLGKEGERDGRM